ncbi:Uncharacterized protein APZ42_024131 [Daphnia magna]|uniref:Uncharacterized protein n=1 Tax=Daphnia magna TaxID=35525 RepID=A0A164UGZ9_9CRUS|nr:Uncharacterized protein APZ42_024131 [Daphnia magna]
MGVHGGHICLYSRSSDWSEAQSKLHHASKNGKHYLRKDDLVDKPKKLCLQTDYFKSAITNWFHCLSFAFEYRRGLKWRKQRMLLDIS